MVSTLFVPKAESSVVTQIVDYGIYQAEIHAIRRSVFVQEQCIPHHLEADIYDPVSRHVLAWWQGTVVGTGRLAPHGRIGRVAVSRSLRRRGIGLRIMLTLLEVAQQEQHSEVFLAAQLHAIQFYEKLGFRQEGGVFSELGIFHVMMRKSLAGLGCP